MFSKNNKLGDDILYKGFVVARLVDAQKTPPSVQQEFIDRLLDGDNECVRSTNNQLTDQRG